MRRLISFLLVIVIIPAMLCSCADKNSPDYRYEHAVKLMNSGKYAEAVTEFDSLNGYKDSVELSRKANARSLNTGKLKAGDIIRFGDYKGHTNWRVLTVNGSEAYITTVDSVDRYPFDGNWSGWDAKDCDIKIWLNDKYINAAFTDYEREIIVEKEGIKVFLLSIEEAYRYFKDNEDRALPLNNELGYWLRNKGIYSDHAAFIGTEPVTKGGIDEYGGLVYLNREVRPALWIRTDTMNSGEGNAEETITESGYFRFRKTGSETELIGLTKEGTKQEKLVIPAGVKIFGRVVDGFSSESLKGVSFESDDDVDYGYLVAGSRTLEKIKLPAKLTKLGVHSNIPNLREIVIPEGVRKIPFGCFENDSNLEKVEIKGNLTEIDAMAFDCCSSLKNLKLPDSVTSIGAVAFQGCTSLNEITLPKNLKCVGEYAFAFCGKLTITVPEEMQLEKWDNAFAEPETESVQPDQKLTVRVKKGSWADQHFKEVFTEKSVKEYY